MKSLTGLWNTAASECAAALGVNASRDVMTVTRRVDTEGVSFLTITLPRFGQDLERALETGCVSSDLFLGFKRKGGLPAFLSGFLCCVFDSVSGTLLNEPNVDAIRAIRQLCYLFKKIELPCAPEREKRALDSFISCEDELKVLDSSWSAPLLKEFSRLSALLFGDVLDAVNREVDQFEIKPKHGPGNTADRRKANQKWDFRTWTDRLEAVFPFVDYGVPNHRYYQTPVAHLAPAQEQPVKVTLVPKTLKTPRVIAIEPTCMQYMQQGLKDSLVPKLESMTPSRYFVGFTDQEPNRLMAREGSRTGALSTLDLSEASDRVSYSLVRNMFRPWPSLLEAVDATRSRTAILPDGRKVRLSKFASMGSALCFPVEAMVFTTIVFLGIQKGYARQLTARDILSFRGQVRVYGDDIVVPSPYTSFVIEALEAFGLKVNSSKSFWNGKFRESCGGDYYAGEWVTPVRVSTVPPVTKSDGRELEAWVALSNNLHKAGLWKSASYCSTLVERVIGTMPCLPHNSSALGLHSFTGISGRTKWDEKLHRHLVSAFVVDKEIPTNEIGGIPALHKTLHGEWSDPLYRDHLRRSGRPFSAGAKRRWVSAS